MRQLAMLSLVVRNCDEAIDFYTRVMRFEVIDDTPMSPRDEAYGRVIVFHDLYGNKWDLIEPKKNTKP